jgi:hypothetical protein
MKRQEEITPTGALGQAIASVACPFCGSMDVELLALFGSQLLTDQYYCRACRTPFEHLRADADEQAPTRAANARTQ